MCLLLIDPQYDFCSPSGSLFVPGAVEDCKTIAKFIDKEIDEIDSIIVTLDTHQPYHIAHPAFWMSADGTVHPKPLEQITAEDVEFGTWKAVVPDHQAIALDYATHVKSITIWPPHCLIGSIGHAVDEVVMVALKKWEAKGNRSVHYVLKGTNAFTEHYSAIKALKVDPTDPTTDVNRALLADLKGFSEILVAGEALSHCVEGTVRDLIDYGDNLGPKITLCLDASSAIPGSEQKVADLKKYVTDAGGQLESLAGSE